MAQRARGSHVRGLIAVSCAALPLLAYGCPKLCAYDSLRAAECVVSSHYVTQVVTTFDQGAWAQILRRSVACEEDCSDGVCETDLLGDYCKPNRTWVARKLAQPVSQGGAGLGDSCGLFGRLLAEGAECSGETTRESCDARAASTTQIGCAWDELQGACDVSKEGVLVLLRRDYKDELARVGLRRQRCAATESQFMCTGDCQWVNGQCTLAAKDALLAIAGEDCPLRVLLSRQNGCTGVASSWECSLRRRPDGLTECLWRQGQCEAHPMSLEFDLLGLLGISHPAAHKQFLEAQTTCSQFTEAACASKCAPDVVVPSRAPPQRFAFNSALALSTLVGLWGAAGSALLSC